MRIISTDTLPETGTGDPQLNRWVYNGLDTCVTKEVFEALEPQLTNATSISYGINRELQAPLLEASLRGILIDQELRGVEIAKLEKDLARVEMILDRLASAAWERRFDVKKDGKVVRRPDGSKVTVALNPRSPDQLCAFFYEHMQLPANYKFDKGERRLTCDKDALEKLEFYYYARPFINCIRTARDITKLLGVLRTGVHADGRMRTSYNIGGAYTFRLSSSESVFGGGTNLQNITYALRRIFIADPGWKFALADLSSAESFVVAFQSGDENYLAACRSGDLHTTVARWIFTDLPWTGDLKKDKDLAENFKFHRHHSYRDVSKRGGHASNYKGVHGLAKKLHVEPSVLERFQETYFSAFPGIRRNHIRIARDLQLNYGTLYNLFGMPCRFYGRLSDEDVIRKAIAFVPQSTVGVLLNKGMLAIWRTLYPIALLVLQIHDAVLCMFREEDEDTIVPKIKALLEIPIETPNGTMLIPADVKTGWNWGSYYDQEMAAKAISAGRKPDPINLDGLKGFKGHDTRKRVWKEVAFLDRRVS